MVRSRRQCPTVHRAMVRGPRQCPTVHRGMVCAVAGGGGQTEGVGAVEQRGGQDGGAEQLAPHPDCKHLVLVFCFLPLLLL